MDASQLIVNEPKVKVDLKQYTERHTFNFDAVFGEDVDNEAVYRHASWNLLCQLKATPLLRRTEGLCICRRSVKPLLTPCLGGGKATCFAYGQTGSGKTYTMQVGATTVTLTKGGTLWSFAHLPRMVCVAATAGEVSGGTTSALEAAATSGHPLIRELLRDLRRYASALLNVDHSGLVFNAADDD